MLIFFQPTYMHKINNSGDASWGISPTVVKITSSETWEKNDNLKNLGFNFNLTIDQLR